MTSRSRPSRPVQVVAAAGAACTVAAAVLYLLVDPLVALGFAGGVLTGAGMLSALVVVLNKLMVPAGERAGAAWPWVLLHVGKFAVVGLFAFAMVVVLHAHVGAFAAGYTVALMTLLIVVGGRLGAHTGRPTWD